MSENKISNLFASALVLAGLTGLPGSSEVTSHPKAAIATPTVQTRSLGSRTTEQHTNAAVHFLSRLPSDGANGPAEASKGAGKRNLPQNPLPNYPFNENAVL